MDTHIPHTHTYIHTYIHTQLEEVRTRNRQLSGEVTQAMTNTRDATARLEACERMSLTYRSEREEALDQVCVH